MSTLRKEFEADIHSVRTFTRRSVYGVRARDLAAVIAPLIQNRKNPTGSSCFGSTVWGTSKGEQARGSKPEEASTRKQARGSKQEEASKRAPESGKQGPEMHKLNLQRPPESHFGSSAQKCSKSSSRGFLRAILGAGRRNAQNQPPGAS